MQVPVDSLIHLWISDLYILLIYTSRGIFLDLETSAKEIFPFHSLFTCAMEGCLPNLQLEVIKMHCSRGREDGGIGGRWAHPASC